MKVICQSRERADVATARCRPYVQEIAHELDIGTSYTVYGQMMQDGCLSYLIAPRDRQGLSHPHFYPAELFLVLDGSIPSSWRFSCHMKHDSVRPGEIYAVWGYDELVESETYLSALQERKEDALLIFVRRKATIDLEEAVP